MTADACATPGCGHPTTSHSFGYGDCGRLVAKGSGTTCPCTAYLPPRPVPEEPRPTILDDVDGDLDEIEQIAEARAQGYGYQPDTGSASRIQTHDDPYRNTRPATVPAPHADAEAAEVAEEAEVWHQWVLDEEPALPPEWWDITRRAVAAGFKAGRGRGDRG